MLDIDAIQRIIPHRYPFLLVDRIVDLTPGEFLVALKNVSINEPYFQGHFPGRPIMPGVLILEGMAQAGGFLLLNSVKKPEEKLMYLSRIEGARFRRPVEPGDQLKFEMKLLNFKLGSCRIEGKAFVGENLVAEAVFLATIGERQA